MKKIKIYVFFLFILINLNAYANDTDFNEWKKNFKLIALEKGVSLKIIENTKDNIFEIDSDMINLIGCSKENFLKLLELMHYIPKKIKNNEKEFFSYKPKFEKNKKQIKDKKDSKNNPDDH